MKRLGTAMNPIRENSLLVLFCLLNILAICIRNNIPIIDLLTIICMLIVGCLYSVLIGKLSNEN